MQPACVAVAYSGGRDSTALLHATLAAARGLGVQVLALHVHHRLQPDADDWLTHCADTCRRWARLGAPVQFHFTRLDGRPAAGDSVEAWARSERYRALREMALANGATAVLLGHHRRDQAETLLLQALRGAGVAGLAAMPRSIERDGITWLRPWLATPHASIDDYVKRHRLRHIHDGSNDDSRYARNRLRADVWPALTRAFPGAETSLAMAAAWAQQASAVLGEIGEADLALIADADGLRIDAWLGLSPARRGNALRMWLAQQTGAPAPTHLVQRLSTELAGAGSARWPIAMGELRRYRGRLSLIATRPTAPHGPLQTHLAIQRAGAYRLVGWGGVLRVSRVDASGVALSLLANLRVVARSGGEQFQSGPGRPPRSLKKQYQANAIPEDARAGPLLYAEDRLIFAAGLGIDARAGAAKGEVQVALTWTPDEGPTHGG